MTNLPELVLTELIRKKVKDLCTEGLITDGAHHKQWFLEEILKTLGYDLNEIHIELWKDDYDWEEGVAP